MIVTTRKKTEVNKWGKMDKKGPIMITFTCGATVTND